MTAGGVGRVWLLSVPIVLVIAVYAWRLLLLRVYEFDPDEFQHLHVAWSVFQGQLPYRDFFEHHTPWFYYFVAPFYTLFRVDTSPDEAVRFIFLARGMSLVLTGLVLAETFWLGRIWRGSAVGWLGVLFLASSIMFLDKTIEIRPDVLASVFWTGAILLVVQGMRATPGAGAATTWRFFLGGVSLGAGIMTTQKLLFALPGLGAAMAWYVVDGRLPGTRKVRVRRAAILGLGIAVPCGLTLALFTASGAGREFIEMNFVLNAGWVVRFSPTRFGVALLVKDPFLVAFGLLGLAIAVVRMARADAVKRGDPILVLSTLGLMGGLLVIPVPYKQYYLTFLPLLAIFAGAALDEVLSWLTAIGVRRDHAGVGVRWWVAASPLFIGAAGLFWFANGAHGTGTVQQQLAGQLYEFVTQQSFNVRDPRLGALVIAPLGPLLVGGGALLVVKGCPWGRAVVLIGVTIFSFAQMWSIARSEPSATLNAVRYVLRTTGPTETVMDGWTGVGVFRPHAYYYFYLHAEMRSMLSEHERQRLIDAVRSGEIVPTLVVLDRNLRAVSDEIARFVEARYEPVGLHDIWRRRTDQTGGRGGHR